MFGSARIVIFLTEWRGIGKLENSGKREKLAHPDQHDIDNWFLYGPKDGQVAELVRELTLDRGLRLAEVESLIIATLEQRKLGLND